MSMRETTRSALRRIAREDGDILLLWRNHPSIRRTMYTSHEISSAEHSRWLDNMLSNPERAGFMFEIEGSPSGFVGVSGLGSRDERAQWTFHLDPELASKGAGTAMGVLALEQIFSVLNVRKLEGEVLSGNGPSLRFHRRLGFREEGYRRAHVRKGGDLLDVHEFSLLREDWERFRCHLDGGTFVGEGPLMTGSNRPRLLFTGGGGSASQSLQEQWGERYDLWFADANPFGFPPSIPKDRRVTIPFAHDTTFADSVLALCKEHAIDLIVPGVDEELLVLARKNGTPGWPRILVPSPEFVTLMLDKLSCAQMLDAAKLGAPKTLPLKRAPEVDFPLIAKPRSGRGSRGVMRLTNEEQVKAYLTLHGGAAEDYIAQELIPGAEYTVFVAADGDEMPRAVIPVRAFEKRGVTVRARTDAHPAIINYACAFQAHFRASGCYNIQCMLTDDGRVLPFEVNPRISTTFVLAIATGFDPIPMALGQKQDTMYLPERHLSLHRSWYTHIASEIAETIP